MDLVRKPSGARRATALWPESGLKGIEPSFSDWEADVLPGGLSRRLGWRLRFAQADGLCVDTDSQDRSCTLFRAPIELHPLFRELRLT